MLAGASGPGRGASTPCSRLSSSTCRSCRTAHTSNLRRTYVCLLDFQIYLRIDSGAMHSGLSLVFQNLDGHVTDAEVYQHELSLAARAEDVGFDSVWTPEHHF